jgi:hypothetical protein
VFCVLQFHNILVGGQQLLLLLLLFLLLHGSAPRARMHLRLYKGPIASPRRVGWPPFRHDTITGPALEPAGHPADQVRVGVCEGLGVGLGAEVGKPGLQLCCAFLERTACCVSRCRLTSFVHHHAHTASNPRGAPPTSPLLLRSCGDCPSPP